MEWLILAFGLVLLIVLVVTARRTASARSALYRIIITVGVCLSLVLIVVGGALVWYNHRPLPSNTTEALFEGVIYTREVRGSPRPLVIHVVSIDLTASGIGFFVTPGEPYQRRQLRAQTTGQFLTASSVQLAINGDFFDPWWSRSLFDYYPHIGDPVDVFGFTASRGDVYESGRPTHPTLYLSEDNRVTIGEPAGVIYNAISGNTLVLRDGVMQGNPNDSYLVELHPRTAVALDEQGTTLLFMIVDGRQPNFSEGVTLDELARLLLDYGAHTAINMDGGGSSTLVMQLLDGTPLLLNSPIDNRIPGRERPVANHLGVVASPLTTP